MVDAARDQQEGLARGARPVARHAIEGRGVGRGWAPGVALAVNDGEARVGDVEAAELVDGVDVRWGRDVEGESADVAEVLEVHGAGSEREAVFWDAGSGDEVAPLSAVLVWPWAPVLADVVLGVVGCVVGAEAFVLSFLATGD